MTHLHTHDNQEPETGITEGGTQGAFRDVLSKDHARRGKAPLHLVDMTPEERKELAQQLGMPAFRVKQLAQHYFVHYDTDVAGYSDFPAKLAQTAQEYYFPQLIEPLLEQEADNGDCLTSLALNQF